MRNRTVLVGSLVAGLVLVGLAPAEAQRTVHTPLEPHQEVPALSSDARGTFELTLSHDRTVAAYTLSYQDFETDVAQAHIHLGQRSVNGGVMIFLCSNLPNPPAGTPACPETAGTVSGTFDATDVIGPTGQGVTPGDFEEFLEALQAAVTYVNVHSQRFPGGEIRGQILLDQRR